MDLSSVEDSNAVRIACGLALATICLAMCSRSALDHTFIKVERSVVSALTVLEKMDSIINNLDRLNMNQRAFLSTGDERFAGEVAQSIMAMSTDVDSLRKISISSEPLRRNITILSHRINLAVDSIEETYDVQQHFGSAAAIALLEDDGTIEEAKHVALSLNKLATEDMFDRVRSECRIRSILELLF